MRSLIKGFFWLVAVLAVGVLLASYPVVGSYQGRAVLAQRVQVDSAASTLFGDGPEYQPIGSPHRVIVDDPKAFIRQGGKVLLNDGYLQKHGIYPLELQTVKYVAHLARVGATIALVVSAIVLLLVRRRRNRPTTLAGAKA